MKESAGRGSAATTAARVKAANRIKAAYRRHLAKFPFGGKVHSESSSDPVVFQEADYMAEPLRKGFGAALQEAAMLDPSARRRELAEVRKLLVPRPGSAASPGLVRVGADAGHEIVFEGGVFQGPNWAAQGYRDTARVLGAASGWRLADMQRWEVDAVLVRFQLVLAPVLAAEVMNRRWQLTVGEKRKPITSVRLVRTVKGWRSAEHLKPGHRRETYYVPIDEREVARSAGLRIVGAPGDAFRLRRDMVRFLGHALGGMSNYRWQLNPRRRRRVRGRAPRWIMFANHGLYPDTAYRILRALHSWRDRMDPSRNWAALYPRPVHFVREAAAPNQERRLKLSIWRLARRALQELGAQLDPEAAETPLLLGHRMYQSLSSSSTSGSRPRRYEHLASARKKAGGPHPVMVASTSICGMMNDNTPPHAGLFLLTAEQWADSSDPSSRQFRFRLRIADPNGKVTFPVIVGRLFLVELRRAARQMVGEGEGGTVTVNAEMVGMPGKGLQYASEGSCGPSSVALLLSMARNLALPPVPTTEGSHAQSAAFMSRVFADVRDEDVVLAVQMLHRAVV